MKKDSPKILESERERLLPSEDKGRLFYDEHLVRYLFASQFVKGKKILDAACGTGYGTWLLAKEGEAYEVWGVDNSKVAINYAKKNYKTTGVSFHLWNLEGKWSVDDNLFDLVISYETIEHLQKQKHFLSETKRVLKKDGILILSTPNPASDPKHIENPFHQKVPTKKELEKLLTEVFPHWVIIPQRNCFVTEIGDLKDRKDSLSAKGIRLAREKPVFGNYVDMQSTSQPPAYFIAVAGKQDIKLPSQTFRLIFDNLQIYKLALHLRLLNRKIDSYLSGISQLEKNLKAREKELDKIYHSKTWRLLWVYKQIVGFPNRIVQLFKKKRK